MTHEVKPLKITFTHFLLCSFQWFFFFFVVTNTLLLGLVQCNGCKKVDLGLVVYSFRDQICWEETMIG